ncbi:MAG TPA: hypothetical protein EYQ27_07600 [Gemmatimonadetes bacterium]|nr:hypothetical protein [Gemmatimonadota bacterium]
MKIISAEEVHAALSYPDLVDELQRAFASEFTMPPRQVDRKLRPDSSGASNEPLRFARWHSAHVSRYTAAPASA